MKHALLVALLVSTLGSGAALAADKCSVPKAEWQAKEALQAKLESEGWKIKQIKVDDGCYEVYGTDARGKRIETHVDPKSFVVVASK